MNYKQNLLGPIEDKSKPRFNIMEVTADRYEDFVCNFDGTIIKYDIDVATYTSGLGIIMRQDISGKIIWEPLDHHEHTVDTLVKVATMRG
jgi:hypothetical protein